VERERVPGNGQGTVNFFRLLGRILAKKFVYAPYVEIKGTRVY